MKISKQRLLDDVLADDDYAALRRTLYFEGLAHLRRRRWERRRHQLLALAACGLFVAGSLFFFGPHPATPRSEIVLGEVVHSVPLRADQVVTDTDSGIEFLRIQPMDLTPGREQFAFEVVRTATVPGSLEFISDNQLFELFPGQPMALVPAGEGGKQLCFLDPTARLLFVERGGDNSL
jgi:hypothetical protein